MKKTTIVVVATGVYLALCTVAQAQAPAPSKNIFVDVNFGVQVNSQDIAISERPVIYGETAFIDSTQSVGNASLLDVTIGYRVWRDLSIALGLTTTLNTTSDATITASIPSPIIFDRRVVTTGTVTDLSHKERTAHLLAVWSTPISDKMDAAVMGGPSFIKVFQGVPVTPVPAGSQIPTFSAAEQTATTVGFTIGGDVTYLVSQKVGVGALVRYVVANADLASVPDLKIGGFQIGGGVRFRF